MRTPGTRNGRRRAVTLILAAALVPAAAGHAAVVEEIAAWVNGEIITRSQLMGREQTLTTQFSSRFVGDELDVQLARMRTSLLTEMIREEILMQRAEILGLELEKVYQQALDQLKAQQGITSNQELEEVLKQEGLTRDELRDTLLRFNVPDIMVNLEVRDKIVVTDDEIEKYFQKNKDEFRTRESFSIREVVIVRDRHTPEEMEDLKTKIAAEIGTGAPFTEVVEKYSEAPSRTNGGLNGPLNPGDLIAQIERTAHALEPGQVSEVLETPQALHWVSLESRTPGKDADLDSARSKIINRLKRDVFTKKLTEYFDMLMETNRVEVNPVYEKYNEPS